MHKLFTLLFVVIAFSARSQTRGDFSGTVTDRKNQPIAGATVYLLNTNYQTSADRSGKFILKSITAGKYTLHISAIGYAAKNIPVIIIGTSRPITIQLNDASNQLDEVTVSAQKTEEQAQRVPFSISTLSAKQIQDYRLWDLKDLTAIVPNLNSGAPGDGRTVTGIRGIVTTSYDPAVATYVDGVNQYGLDTYIPQLLDVDRIEVLRGPQGTLYGRNATGGVINVITRQPSNTLSGFAGVDVGNYNQQRYTLGIKAPLVKDKLYLGVAGIYSGFNGFYTNTFNNTHFDKQHYFLGNYYLKFLATSKLAFTLNVKNYNNRNNGAFTLAGSPDDALSHPFEVNQNATTKMVDNTFQSSLTANYSGNDFNFTSQTSYQVNNRYYTTPIDGDFSPIDAVSIINNYGGKWNKVKTTIQEFRFTSPASSTSKLKWAAGTYGFYHYAPNRQGTYFGDDAGAVGSPVTDFTSINTNTDRNYGIAVYGQATYAVNEQFDITAGLRYDYEHKKENVMGEFLPKGGESVVTRSDTSSTAHYKAFTPKVSLAYHVSAHNNLFATYSRGFRAGGITELGSDPSSPPLYSFKPEYSNNFEVGSKNDFLDNRLRVNVTAFYTRVTDAQVPTLVLPDAITVTKNAGKLSSKGIEAEITATPIKGLEFDYNFGYTHARYTTLVVGSNGEEVNLKGNKQIYTPNITSMLALQYGYDLGGLLKTKLIARGEWRYLGDQYFDLANQIEQKGYNKFNARVGVSTKRFGLFFWESNIANKKYIDYAYDFGATHLGNPRTYGVSLNTTF
ncbi:TonB-dependent receptor [Mucilaginibacter rubeus]|uniref:TonB-dependent receptor n=1 Tax=Mucilaginibacter rubeus TaxID=2027860 RepID=A0AAE6JME8_9SPHI|nr:TonB-dependent receptor [Mucilaginibacter rubeus]QEM08068.1 TonB-dependent receptor [Mucilaginibacter rubeus]QTE42755.1 TonB-dependent receptor [Mucilaginibacter rubeus]QTE49356.1 TonB-dependent receptor [Mucilaginibacter rubeus]QTE54452.1 TonB-dependent receptor [Mucilaginibacter rubeus]QTE66093.1 TonB-dependent receptor [Mucilaginibacter rubeus]